MPEPLPRTGNFTATNLARWRGSVEDVRRKSGAAERKAVAKLLRRRSAHRLTAERDAA